MPATMLEIVLAMAVFAAMSASFLGFINYLDKANDKTVLENSAIEVLDNVVERISAVPTSVRSPKLTQRILDDELALSPLPSANIAAKVKPLGNGNFELLISDSKHGRLASLVCGPPPKTGENSK